MVGAKQSAPLLRSLVRLGGFNSILNKFPSGCRLIRVLVHDNITWLEKCLSLAHFQQVNMRALVFNLYGPQSAYSILSLISACWNLQTLYMMKSSCDGITVPYEIWEMPQLRHLQANAVLLTDPACGEGSEQQEGIVLQNLHTLEVAVNLRLTEEVRKRMPNLKKLKVLYNHFRDDYYLHNLVRFNKLKSLEISLFGGSKWCDVAPSLTFPPSLEELELRDCHLGWEDLTVLSSSLPHLGSLRVSLVPGSEWNLDEEEFCCLKTLMIEQCHDLTYLNANSSNFPVLKSLVLCIVPKLSEIPLDIGEIPTLRIIHLTGCGASAAFSAARIVAEQEANGNHDIQTHLHFWDHKPEEFERFQEMLLREECLTSNSIHLYYGGKKFKAF